MIRIVIAEDQGLLLGALAALLELESDIEVVARASNGREAYDAVRRCDPDVLVSDIEMPEMTGLDLAAAIARDGLRARVLIVTTFARPGYLRRAMEAGVKGYVLKDAPAEDLVSTVRRIAAGERVVAPELMDAAWTGEDPLNPRERELLRLAEQGQDTRAMSQQTGLALGTVRNYLHEAISKTGASNRVEAARIARRNGWL